VAEPVSHTYRLFDQHMLVLCESQPMIEHINRFMWPLEIQDGIRDSIRVAIFQEDTPRGPAIQVCSPELQFWRNEPLGLGSWVSFRHVCLHMILARTHPHFVAHGSAVADKDGRAMLIVGAANTGKTSVMLGLLRRGWRYVVDDYSVVRFSDGRLRALTMGCTVSQDTFVMFPELEDMKSPQCHFVSDGSDQWTINPCDRFASVAQDDALEIAHIFILHPNHGGESRIESCEPSWAMWLLQHRRFETIPRIAEPDPRREEQEYRLLRGLTERVPCHHVTNGDIMTTVSLIEDAFRA